MATESDGEEDTTGKLSGSQNLAVDDDSREMAKKAAWSVSSCKPGNGVPSLRDDNLETYWQSDGAQPHLVNIQFQKKVKLHVMFCLRFFFLACSRNFDLRMIFFLFFFPVIGTLC
ncbi:Anaphase-promoting complex subunit 10 [Dendrobium catenatum]|uniref:Anaphase-promoting complex subunit 10 n=1 Tax=Dendrobium catenatum TaxID=906689 RepID=A0A2I0VIR4_9ASPA|nr:Anaphase-promoting complex subunit 10 [Dendrobium catenatum]